MPTANHQDLGFTRSFRRVTCLPVCLALTMAGAAIAQTPGGPPPGAGQTIQSLARELAALTARVARLEGQIVAADLAGAYALRGLQVELRAPNNGAAAQVASYVLAGTVTLAVDGSATFSAAEDGSKLLFGTLSVSPHQFSETGVTSWAYSNGVVTIAGAPPLSVAAGGRVLMGATANHGNGTEALLLLTRLQ
jgi:hypothetical protein